MTLASIKSVLLLMICSFINQMSYFLFGFESLAFDIIAPVNEETMRLISVIKGPPTYWLFTSFLVSYEFLTYIKMINNDYGCIPVSLLFMRIWCIIFHFMLLTIQLQGRKLYKKSDKKIYLISSYLLAIVIHFMWNTKVSLLVSNFF